MIPSSATMSAMPAKVVAVKIVTVPMQSHIIK